VKAAPESDHREHLNTQPRGPFIPLLLLLIGFVGWVGTQTTQLLRERWALKEMESRQAAALAQAHKIRLAADSLASKTQALAAKGNPNAQVVVAKLKERGVTIDPSAPTPEPP
jgi:hypothetical protein